MSLVNRLARDSFVTPQDLELFECLDILLKVLEGIEADVVTRELLLEPRG